MAARQASGGESVYTVSLTWLYLLNLYQFITNHLQFNIIIVLNTVSHDYTDSVSNIRDVSKFISAPIFRRMTIIIGVYLISSCTSKRNQRQFAYYSRDDLFPPGSHRICHSQPIPNSVTQFIAHTQLCHTIHSPYPILSHNSQPIPNSVTQFIAHTQLCHTFHTPYSIRSC
jgi:hypothetical protein